LPGIFIYRAPKPPLFCTKKSFERINRQQVATKGYVFVRSYTSSSLRTGAERKLGEDPLPPCRPAASAARLPCLLLCEGERARSSSHPTLLQDKMCLLHSYANSLKVIFNSLHTVITSPLILALQWLNKRSRMLSALPFAIYLLYSFREKKKRRWDKMFG